MAEGHGMGGGVGGNGSVDVVVVGAGPAGSAAATTLARAGRSVILLDRAAFPRDKPCGDLIGVRALAWARCLGVAEADLAPYPPLVGALVAADGGAVDLAPRSALGRASLRGSDARVIPRLVFDAALVRAAERAGAELRRCTVREVGPWRGGPDGGREVTGVGPDGPVRLQVRAVVAAGGYGCRVAAGIAPAPAAASGHPSGGGVGLAEPPRGIAMRGYFRGVDAPAGRIAFCLNGWVLPGYGWVFPLPDGGANVGVGTLVRGGAGEREHLRRLYERFVDDPASPAAGWLAGASADGEPRSWPLDLGPRRRRLAADGLLVAGEAGALVGPLTGAGIAFALDTGARAGEALATALAAGDLREPALRPYARAVRRRFLPWLRAEGVAQRWLTDPDHLRALLAAVRPLPPAAPLGARLLLHLG